MSPSNEREPLLRNNAAIDTDRTVNRVAKTSGSGPLDVSKARRFGILAGVFCATFLSSLNMTLVPTMLPSISSEFNASHQASWLGTSYLLATSTFNPLYGRLCDVLGRRGACQVAVFFACIGTIACGLSTDMNVLIAARFLAGIGGGGIFTVSSIVSSDLYSLRSRGLIQGIASVFNGLGMGLGGPVGGIITDRLGWRWAFLAQLPLFLLSMFLVTVNLNYVTPGKGKSTWDVLARIDYGGILSLLIATGSCLFFLSTRYNQGLPWSDARVIAPLTISGVFVIVFLFIELRVAKEPMLDSTLLRQKVPVLSGISNFLVANCNFAITYFFPMWFQVVMLTSASTAGLHLAPNSVSMSVGSLFAGWMIHKTGKYKLINVIFGFFPFIGTLLILNMKETSGPLQLWLSIIPMGFGNAVVMQTMLIALLAHVPESKLAVGTGFNILFRGIGQVGGVAIASAIFQSVLDANLRKRIHTPDSEELIQSIRQSTRMIEHLPPDIQRMARDSYSTSLHSVFIYASCATFLSYLVRLPVPEKSLDDRERKSKRNDVEENAAASSVTNATVGR